MRDFDVKFEYPFIFEGYWCPETKKAYVFGRSHDEESTIDTIKHECIHYAVQKVAGKRATQKFDRLARKVLKWDEEIYKVLY